jgi:hypothetical protein
MALSEWIYRQTDATHRIALDRLAKLVGNWLQQERAMPAEMVTQLIASDYAGDKQHQQGGITLNIADVVNTPDEKEKTRKAGLARQVRHQSANV